MANLASRVPKSSWPMVATLVRSIFEQADRYATWEQLGDVVEHLTQAGFSDIAVIVLDAAGDILAFSAFPTEHWPKIRSNSPQERLNRRSVGAPTSSASSQPGRGHPPGGCAAGRADREWAIAKHYMSAETLRAARHQGAPATDCHLPGPAHLLPRRAPGPSRHRTRGADVRLPRPAQGSPHRGPHLPSARSAPPHPRIGHRTARHPRATGAGPPAFSSFSTSTPPPPAEHRRPTMHSTSRPLMCGTPG